MKEKIKVILVGESHVGKTSIIRQFLDNKFDSEYMPTMSSERTIKEIKLKNEKEYILEIWDTIGQEKYRSTNKIFMKNGKIALLVYDITNKQSFENLPQFYHQLCECNGKDIIIGVAGNKSDLYEERVIEEEEGKEYAKRINALFFETSAKEYDCIENVFQVIVEQFDKETEKRQLYEGKENKKIIDDKKMRESFRVKKQKKKKIFC